MSGPVPAGAWRALAVGAAGFVLFGFNSTATNLAFGSIADTFDTVSETTVSWVASGFFIASAAMLPLGGRLADRVGRRRIFQLGLIGFAASALASALAPNIWVLIASRVAQATAGALVIPSSLAMALPRFPPGRRSSAVATWSAAGPLSAALAPSGAAALLGATSWRVVYLISAPAAVLILALSFAYVTDSRGDDADGRLDLVGTVTAVSALTLLVVGITQASTWGWSAPITLGALVAGLVLGLAFIARSARHPTPLVNVELFRIPEVAVANVANLFMSITSLSIWLVWPLFLIRVWGFSVQTVGVAITIGPIFAGSAALAGGRLADRYGQRWLMVVGSAITTAAVSYGAVMIAATPDYPLRFAPMVAMFGLGWGISNPSMNSWALSKVPADVFGETNAAFNTIRNLGAAVGTAAVFTIIGAAGGDDVVEPYRRAYVFFAVSVGLSFLTVAVGTYWIGRRTPVRLRPTAS
ncbi:MAG: MFS transporter [Actinomycetota bacterium]